MKEIRKEDTDRLEKLFEEDCDFAIISHVNPDGDALGSSCGLFHFLKSLGKNASVILPTQVPDTISFIAEGIDIIIGEKDPEEASRLINGCGVLFCLDFNSPRRTDCLESAIEESKAFKVLVDHHLAPEREKFNLVFSETQVSSASELLYHVLMQTQGIGRDASKLPPASAYCLMCGMTTDTNNFANSVFPETLEMASQLIAAGVDRDDILMNIYNKYAERRFRLMGYLLKDKLTITEEGVAYMILDKETIDNYGVEEGDTEGLVNIPLGIKEVRMSIFLKEKDDKFRVSIRSEKGTSANRCAMQYFHGGGHENAAGGRLDKPSDVASAADAARYIEEKTKEFFGL